MPLAALVAVATRQARCFALIGTFLTLPAFAGELAPVPQSGDATITAVLRHEHGDGVAMNAGRAAEMYCAAAREGNADAAYRLGWMYANGIGVERNDRHATALFRRAAVQGHAAATRMLETMSTGDARQPLCMTLEPPPTVTAKPDADGEPPLPTGRENSATASVYGGGATHAGSMATAPPLAAPPDGDQVLLAVARWGDAWSQRQVGLYLAAYAPDFQLPAGESRQQWERQRRARIADKAWIDIKLHDLTIAVEDDLARVRFLQEYRSDKGRDSTIKTLTLVKSGRTWLIRREQSEALPSSPLAR
ncbi:hypothetical protein [Sulfuritalea sp.]|uniref:L,D-transpeptidase Cds6 family protein n=1 Tax=Sulfuritalea sp. TaxID=2480090 RepID=UPI00286E5AD0|nr:hypothetical protein [Sulfuritalea sp.]